MKTTDAISQKMLALESHPKMVALVEGIDRFIQLLMNRKYRGHNPAVAAAYAPLRASMIVISAITVITVVFGLFVPVESAAIARGKVAVLSKRKTVQHLEGGIVKRILVEDGDAVKKGQPLIEISDVAPKANREIVKNELLAQRASEARLAALHDDREVIAFPAEVLKAAEHNPDLSKTIKVQEELFATQREAQHGKLDSLQQHIAQLQEEITGLQAQIKSADGQLALTEEEIASVIPLLKEGLATKPRLLALERQAEQLRGSRGQNLALIAKAEQGITEARMDIINQKNEFATQIAQDGRDVREKTNDLEEKLRTANDVVTRTTVTAPSEGIVTGLKFHTVGGVISPGASILDIVPQSDKLVLEVRIQPTDIDVVKPGLDARVVFPAYKARRMPLFTGKVTQVSADSFSEEQGLQTVSYYTARVEVDGDQLGPLDSGVSMYPGMPADIYVRTG